MIYTSYYANLKNIDDTKYYLIRISNTSPFSIPLSIPYFIPDWKTMINPHKKKEIDDEEFKKRYLKQLENNKDIIKIVIDKLLDSTIPSILLCYEKPDSFCHRFILSEFINKLYDKEVIRELS